MITISTCKSSIRKTSGSPKPLTEVICVRYPAVLNLRNKRVSEPPSKGVLMARQQEVSRSLRNCFPDSNKGISLQVNQLWKVWE